MLKYYDLEMELHLPEVDVEGIQKLYEENVSKVATTGGYSSSTAGYKTGNSGASYVNKSNSFNKAAEKAVTLIKDCNKSKGNKSKGNKKGTYDAEGALKRMDKMLTNFDMRNNLSQGADSDGLECLGFYDEDDFTNVNVITS
jgi:hypothetical protein